MWRATPSILDVRIPGPGGHAPAWSRGPNPSGGFQIDARFDTLQNQALSASHTQPGVTPAVIDRPFSDAKIAALLAYLRKL